MKLTRIEFSNYRSIQSASIDVDARATVLMGRNDVGKSNILQGLLAFGSRDPFLKEDMCRHANPPGAPPNIALHFAALTEGDKKDLGTLPVPLSPRTSLTLVREGDELTGYSVFVDDKPVPLILPPAAAPTTEGAEATGSSSGQSQPAPGGTPQTPQSGEAPPATPLDATPSPDQRKKFIQRLWSILPEVSLFETPEPLPSRVTIDELEADDPKFETARRLLMLAGVTSFRSLAPDDYAFGRDFRGETGARLTRLLRDHWFQDAELTLELDYQAPHLLFTFKEATSRSTYPEQHSPATSEYVAVLADVLSQLSDQGDPASYILLFDEPGTRLHPGGQRDLLMLLSSLSNRHQIIYTSHFPYLIDRNFPGQVRLVTKTQAGTVVNNKPHASQDPYFTLPYEPIRKAIGVGLGDSLVFDDFNIILEGPSDQILIAALSQALARSVDTATLDLNRTSLMPAGSASNIESIARMAKVRHLPVIALFDSDEAGEAEAARLRKKVSRVEEDPATLLPREIIVTNDAFSEKKQRCTEDLIPSRLYFEAVNAFYSSIYADWKSISSKAAAFKSSDKPIAKLCDEYFTKDLQSQYGGFDKVRVARQLAATLAETETVKADGQIRAEFEPAAKLIHMMKTSLEGGEPQRVPEAEQAKPNP